MGARQEAVVQEFMDAWGDGTQELPDVDKIISLFAEDVVWKLWIPGGPTIRGRDSARKDIERQVTFATYMQCGLIDMASNDRFVHTERLDHFMSNGTRVAHHLMAVFEVDENDKIAAWREYFDTKDLEKQLAKANATVPRAAV